ncbi:hypothetical protein COOONC_14216, partial [Cooperia oncophora]
IAASVGIPTTPPHAAPPNSQSSNGHNIQSYQQAIGMDYQSPPVISPSNTPQSQLVQGHLPQQGYSASTPYSYPQTVVPANQESQVVSPNGHHYSAASGTGSQVQGHAGNDGQFFHQQQYQAAPPIRR